MHVALTKYFLQTPFVTNGVLILPTAYSITSGERKFSAQLKSKTYM